MTGAGLVGGGIEGRSGVPEDALIDQAAAEIPHRRGDDAALPSYPTHASEGLTGI